MSSDANSAKIKNLIKLQSKRNVELWIYSFADMYMILSVFFISLAVLYAAQVKNQQKVPPYIPSAGRGPAAVVSEVQVTFDSGSAELSHQALEEIDLLMPALKGLKEGTIEVEGYADGKPPAHDSGFSSNLHLSGVRAVNVAEYLIKKGVSPRRIKTVGYGDGYIWNDSSVPNNRRVIIKIASYRRTK